MTQHDLKQLFRLYQSNRISEQELQVFFALLEQAEHDETLKQLLDEAWNEIPGRRPFRQQPIRRRLLYSAAAALLVLILGVGWLLTRQHATAPLFTRTNATGRSPLPVTLPDGSRAWLNAASSLLYRNREVTVTGEVYFEVVPDAGQPFIVHSGDLRTQVLGTAFNVSAYSEDPTFSITVLSGKVSVQVPTPQGYFALNPEDQLVYTPSTHALIRQHNTDASAWTKGVLILHNVPVPEAINRLQRRFNIKIEVDENLRHCLFYGDFAQETPDEILHMLATSVNGKVTKEHGGYYLTGTGCF